MESWTFPWHLIIIDHRSSVFLAQFSYMLMSCFAKSSTWRSINTTIDRRWSLGPTSHWSWSRLFSYICQKYTIWRRLHSSISHSTSQQFHCYMIGSRYVRGIRRQSQGYTSLPHTRYIFYAHWSSSSAVNRLFSYSGRFLPMHISLSISEGSVRGYSFYDEYQVLKSPQKSEIFQRTCFQMKC